MVRALCGDSISPPKRRISLFLWGNNSDFGPNFAEDIDVQPGNHDVIAVSLKNSGISPRHAGVVIYDNGVKRSLQTAGHTGSNVIEFSDSPSTLYGLQ